MRHVAKLLLTCLALGTPSLVLPHSVAHAAEQRVAVVDIQRCILETTEGKRASKELESAFASSQVKFERKGKNLRKQVEDLQAKASMLSPAELQRRAQDLQRKEQELQQLYQKLGQDLQQKEALLAEKIYARVQKLVGQLALEDNLEVVLVKSQATVLYVNPTLDLTNRVILAYDKKHK